MEFFFNMLNLQFMLFLLILTGILVKKLEIIDIQSRKSLSDLLIYVILPCNIIQSFLGEISITDEFFRNCMIALLLSLLIQIFSIYSSRLLFRRYPDAKKNVMSYGLICSNSSFIGIPIAAVSKCTVPVSMIVIGAILADANVKTLFSRSVLYFMLLRLVVFPVFIFLILKPFSVDSLLASICVIMSGMPAGSTGSILAEKYGCDSMFASQLIFVSTFCSIFTIPLLGLLIK